jgi:sulfur-oxidizing protein SoxX
MKTLHIMISGVILAAFAAGCDAGPNSGKGLSLPQGSIERGKAAFQRQHCNYCHRVQGTDFPAPRMVFAKNVTLGGIAKVLPTQGALVTAITNPSHDFAPGFDKTYALSENRSPMPDFKDRMTVGELVDIVAFLQSRYELPRTDHNAQQD